MKKAVVLLVTSMLISSITYSQKLENLDHISPFHDGLAAIKKGDQWAFIDNEGQKIIDFRSDLVDGKKCEMACCANDAGITYPFFKDGLALVSEIKDEIFHYGYINKYGEIEIEVNLINATHFNNGKAIVQKYYKESLGKNDLLGKNVISYSYNEVIINTKGEVIMHLSGPFNLLFSKDKLKTPPAITSRLLNHNLVATKTENDTWKIRTINK